MSHHGNYPEYHLIQVSWCKFCSLLYFHDGKLHNSWSWWWCG